MPWLKNKLHRLRKRDGDKCGICNLRMIFINNLEIPNEFRGLIATVDHIVEKRNNGTNELSNLRLTHQWCNGSRDNYNARACRRRVYHYWYRKNLGLNLLFNNQEITLEFLCKNKKTLIKPFKNEVLTSKAFMVKL